MLEDDDSLTVWSSDLMGAMLEVGKKLVKKISKMMITNKGQITKGFNADES